MTNHHPQNPPPSSKSESHPSHPKKSGKSAPHPRPSAPHPAYHLLRNITTFSQQVIGIPLRDYQLAPIQAVIESVLRRTGREYLFIFPRQSGKNEATAQLLVYLLNLLHRRGGNIVYAAIGDSLERGISRLEERLHNPLNAGQWRKTRRPRRRILGKAAVVFISSNPNAYARGETADWLLVVDELQDQNAAHLEAVFTPMRAANNATALYLGTVRTTTDALWQKKTELEALQATDGIRRVFLVSPEEVTAANPAYGTFLASQIARHGRNHPTIRAEYFLEPLDAAGGLFPPRRLALLRGNHPRQHTPTPGHTYAALLDVAGQDEAATSALAQLDNPGRDYTVCTIVELLPAPATRPAGEIAYRAIDVFVDQGTRHFEQQPGRPPLAEQLLTYLQHWQVAHVIADATGVGEGITDWLAARLGERVKPFKFTPRAKARLGSTFITLLETGRVSYWQPNTNDGDAWWLFTQAAHCTYNLSAGGTFNRHLRWGVPPTARVTTPAGTLPVHDDRLLSLMLVAELERLRSTGQLPTGRAAAEWIDPNDPLHNMDF